MKEIKLKENLIEIPKCKVSKVGLEFDENITFEQWSNIGAQLQAIQKSVGFWIGDWLNFGENKPEWGEMYTQAIDETGLDYQTIADYKWVTKEIPFSWRQENLSFTTHHEIASAPKELQETLLQKASNENLKSRDVRELVKESKKLPTPPLPEGKYQVIYADPPWCYGDKHDYNGTTGAETYYPSMTIDELCEMNIPSADDAVLFLWVTSPLLDECWPVIKAWGFEYKTSFVWDKVKHNMGHYNSVRHEFLLICTKGSFTPENKTLFDSVITEERSDIHSEKPERVYEIIETLYPSARYLELFSRKKRGKWVSWGNDERVL